MEENKNIIEFKSVSLYYEDDTEGLVDVNFKIAKGEFAFLVGGSGHGKSTVLKLIYRDAKATSGKVMVAGHDVSHLSRLGIARLRRRLGVVFQDFNLLEERTVKENLRFAMQVVDTPKSVMRRREAELLNQVGLSDRKEAFPKQLSGGEQQRLCIARALINNPPILLADEPTGNLDPKTSMEIMKLLEEINLKGTTILMATHDDSIVDRMKKRVLYFKDNQLVKDLPVGSYSELEKIDNELSAIKAANEDLADEIEIEEIEIIEEIIVIEEEVELEVEIEVEADTETEEGETEAEAKEDDENLEEEEGREE